MKKDFSTSEVAPELAHDKALTAAFESLLVPLRETYDELMYQFNGLDKSRHPEKYDVTKKLPTAEAARDQFRARLATDGSGLWKDGITPKEREETLQYCLTQDLTMSGTDAPLHGRRIKVKKGAFLNEIQKYNQLVSAAEATKAEVDQNKVDEERLKALSKELTTVREGEQALRTFAEGAAASPAPEKPPTIDERRAAETEKMNVWEESVRKIRREMPERPPEGLPNVSDVREWYQRQARFTTLDLEDAAKEDGNTDVVASLEKKRAFYEAEAERLLPEEKAWHEQQIERAYDELDQRLENYARSDSLFLALPPKERREVVQDYADYLSAGGVPGEMADVPDWNFDQISEDPSALEKWLQRTGIQELEYAEGEIKLHRRRLESLQREELRKKPKEEPEDAPVPEQKGIRAFFRRLFGRKEREEEPKAEEDEEES